MANSLIENYVDYLRKKFPTCKVEDFFWERKDTYAISVSWEDGEDWFEMPIYFHEGITPQKWSEAQQELEKWEEVIGERLENRGCLAISK